MTSLSLLWFCIDNYILQLVNQIRCQGCSPCFRTAYGQDPPALAPPVWHRGLLLQQDTVRTIQITAAWLIYLFFCCLIFYLLTSMCQGLPSRCQSLSPHPVNPDGPRGIPLQWWTDSISKVRLNVNIPDRLQGDFMHAQWKKGNYRHFRNVHDFIFFQVLHHELLDVTGGSDLLGDFRCEGFSDPKSISVHRFPRRWVSRIWASLKSNCALTTLYMMYERIKAIFLFFVSKESGTRCILMTWGIQRTWAWTCLVSVGLSLAAYSTPLHQVETIHPLGFNKIKGGFVVLWAISYCKVNGIFVL